jgi:hypothetical protein
MAQLSHKHQIHLPSTFSSVYILNEFDSTHLLWWGRPFLNPSIQIVIFSKKHPPVHIQKNKCFTTFLGITQPNQIVTKLANNGWEDRQPLRCRSCKISLQRIDNETGWEFFAISLSHTQILWDLQCNRHEKVKMTYFSHFTWRLPLCSYLSYVIVLLFL